MNPRPTRRTVLLCAAAVAVWRPAPGYAAGPDDAKLLNTLLAIEHAVIYDLSAAGATLPIGRRAQVLTHYDEHRIRRDALTVRITALGGAPVAALAAYADPVAGANALADIETIERAGVQGYHGAITVVADTLARDLCAQAFIAECRHWALARAAAGLPGAPVAFVTGA